jgi:hypothetical protein
MERKLDEIVERQVRSDTAQEYRHQIVTGQLHRHEQILLELYAKAHSIQAPGLLSGLVKVPVALALPVVVFLVMLAVTGDPRTAFKAARGAGPG